MPQPPLIPPPLDPHHMALIRMAVREDMGHGTYGTLQGDRTVELAIPQELRGVATIVARKPGVISGTYLLPAILREYQVGIDCTTLTPDGIAVQPGTAVAQISGSVRTILSAERVLLNFLGHLSGIATLTRRYVDAIAGTNTVICDIRKTTPAFRVLDKYAVRCGGGVNHRMGLYDGVMLKDNHLAALRERFGKDLTLAKLTKRIRGELPTDITLWLEVDTLDQLADEIAGGGANIILLDNMSCDQMRRAVQMRDALPIDKQSAKTKTPLLEASGGITLENVRSVAETGVDRISIGALTHSAPVLDLSLELA